MDRYDGILAAICIIAIIFFGALMIGFRNGAIQDHAKINTELQQLKDDRDFTMDVAEYVIRELDDIVYADEIKGAEALDARKQAGNG